MLGIILKLPKFSTFTSIHWQLLVLSEFTKLLRAGEFFLAHSNHNCSFSTAWMPWGIGSILNTILVGRSSVRLIYRMLAHPKCFTVGSRLPAKLQRMAENYLVFQHFAQTSGTPQDAEVYFSFPIFLTHSCTILFLFLLGT